MSGFFGAIDKNGIKMERLQKVSQSLLHRGPDDEGFLLLSGNHCHEYKGTSTRKDIHLPHIEESRTELFWGAFIHRRLETIDLTARGHQPMSFSEELWIVFDGAIYNYPELKKELQSKGHFFRSNSDTEVILASYKEWGTNCVNHFNGMWAFAILDKRNNSLFLSRDRFAEKPLYYYHKDGVFLFASEMKAILTYLDVKPGIRTGVERYNQVGSYQVGETEKTMFDYIVQLMHSNNMIYRNDNFKIERYYSVPLNVQNKPLTENIQTFRELFLDAIRIRLRADVEPAALLSGGLDSSSIISYASSSLGKTLKTVSSTFPGYPTDESVYQNAVISKHHCDANRFTPDLSRIFELTDQQIRHLECPLDHINSLTQWYTMEKSGELSYKVVLDGQGSDELLAGYPPLMRTYLPEMLFNLRIGAYLNNFGHLKRYNYHGLIPTLRILKTYALSAIRNEKKPQFFRSLNEHLYYLLDVAFLPYFYHFGDRAAQAHSIEDRCPFADYRLVEFMFTVPADQKIRNSIEKFLLREAMKPELPEEVYKRTRKVGQMTKTPVEEAFSNDIINHFNEETLKCLKDYHVIKDKSELLNMAPKKVYKLYGLGRFIHIFG